MVTFSEYLALERQEMLRHKWIESEKAGHDLGQTALMDWVDRYGIEFHHYIMARGGIDCDTRRSA